VAWTKGRKTASAAPSMPIIDAAGHLTNQFISIFTFAL
jgi:hypothetical protein